MIINQSMAIGSTVQTLAVLPRHSTISPYYREPPGGGGRGGHGLHLVGALGVRACVCEPTPTRRVNELRFRTLYRVSTSRHQDMKPTYGSIRVINTTKRTRTARHAASRTSDHPSPAEPLYLQSPKNNTPLTSVKDFQPCFCRLSQTADGNRMVVVA